jgi:hypothetical protein
VRLSPVQGATRVVFTLDLVFSAVAGGVLYGLSTRTEDYFAWTIAAPLTAAVLGSGYLAAVVLLVPSYAERAWARVRIIPVLGFTLTFVTLLVTLWRLEEFHLGAGSGTARVAGWAWLAVYVAVPVLLAAVFVRQERAGGRGEYGIERPLLPETKVLLGGVAGLAGVLGLGLLLTPGSMDGIWPWPLPPLAAGAVAAWLLTIAAACAWGLRDGDWGRFRIALPGLAAYGVLVAVAVARYPEPLDGGDGQERAFLVVGLLVAAAWVAVVLRQERSVEHVEDAQRAPERRDEVDAGRLLP